MPTPQMLFGSLEALRDSVKSRYVPDTSCSVPTRHSVGGFLGGVGSSGTAAGVGEGTVLAGAVVTDRVGTDELFPDRDLDGVTHDRDLHLTSTVFHTDVVVLRGEAHVPGRIHLPGDRHHPRRGPLNRCLPRCRHGSSGHRRSLFRRCMATGMGRDEHTAVMDLHEAAVHDLHDLLTREVAGDEVRRSPERHRSLP